jgi:hypothetical protein
MANVKINVKDIKLKMGVKWNVTKYKKAQKELVSLLGQAGLDNTDKASPEKRETED